MMPFDHDTIVGFAKSFGLFYLVALSAIALVWTYWPSHKKTFDEAAEMRRLFALGVDGIVTDRPRVALDVVADLT